MYHALDTHQLALQEQVGADYERCAKIKEWKMIIDAELEERQQRVHWVSARKERQGEYSFGIGVPGKLRDETMNRTTFMKH